MVSGALIVLFALNACDKDSIDTQTTPQTSIETAEVPEIPELEITDEVTSVFKSNYFNTGEIKIVDFHFCQTGKLTALPFSDNVSSIYTSGRKCNFKGKGCDAEHLQPINVNGWFWAGASNTRIPKTDNKSAPNTYWSPVGE